MNLVYIFILFSLLYVLQMFFNKNLFIKMIVITYLFIVSSAIYFSFDSYKGWPSSDRIEKAILINVQVFDPTESTPGAIYLWVYDEPKEQSIIQKVFGYTPSAYAPRAYVLPYTKSTKDKFEEAKKQMEMGMTVELSSGEPVKEEGDASENEKGSGQQVGGGESSGLEYDVPSIKILPPDQILRKE